MSRLQWFSLCTLSLTAACGDSGGTFGPTSIMVSTVRAPEAIAFREGLDGEWQTPAPTTTGTYELVVNGPYVVSVVCNAGDGFIITTRQIARTPEDGRDLDLECAELPLSSSTVTGKMVQPGSVALGGGRDFSTTPDWDFMFATPAGTFDLIAFSDQRIAIRRDLAVSGNMNVGTVDVAQQGVPLVPVALTSPNVAASEMLEAQVLVSTPRTDAGYVHVGAPAAARVASSELLTADVRQSVTMIAWGDDSARSARRDFRAGDPTAFKLPDPLGAVQFDTASGDLVATWSTLPEHDKIVVNVSGSMADNAVREQHLELSQRFAAATGATSAAIDTDLPGYLPAWRPVYTREYVRELAAVREQDGEQLMSTTFKLVNEQPLAPAARPHLLGTQLAQRRLAR